MLENIKLLPIMCFATVGAKVCLQFENYPYAFIQCVTVYKSSYFSKRRLQLATEIMRFNTSRLFSLGLRAR